MPHVHTDTPQQIAVMTFTDLVSHEDTEEQVKLVEVNLAGTVCVQHIKHVVDLSRLEIGHMMYYLVELDVYIVPQIQSMYTVSPSQRTVLSCTKFSLSRRWQILWPLLFTHFYLFYLICKIIC